MLLLCLLQLFKEGLGFKVLRDEIVQPGNDLVDLLLPAGVQVAAGQHRFEKLAQCLLNHPAKAVGHLNRERERIPHADSRKV
jgi:hypothetical protein